MHSITKENYSQSKKNKKMYYDLTKKNLEKILQIKKDIMTPKMSKN
jgi:hypothetical protein